MRRALLPALVIALLILPGALRAGQATVAVASNFTTPARALIAEPVAPDTNAAALDADVDAFLLCGDAYHTADPTPTQQDIFVQCLRPLADAGIPIVLIVGNHDHPVTFGRASSLDIFDHIAGEVYCYRKPASEVQVLDTKRGPLQLIPLPWPIRSQILTKEEYRSMTPEELRQFIEERYVTYVQRRADEIADETLMIPETSERAAPVLANVQLQLFSYHLADALGRPIDKPRNLAKSVTVE